MDIAEIISELDDHGFEDLEPTRKVEKIQDTIWQLEGLHPWPFLETALNLNFDGTNAKPSNFPTDFRASIRVKDLVTGRRILPIGLDEFEDRVGLEHAQAGDPEVYYFEGLDLKVWPVPPVSTGRIKLRYIQWSDAITSTTLEAAILIPRYFHGGLIVNGAVSRIYDMEDDPELAARFEARQQASIQMAIEALFKRQYDRPEHIAVVDPDDWDDYRF